MWLLVHMVHGHGEIEKKKSYLTGRIGHRWGWRVDGMSLDCRCLTSGLSRDCRGRESWKQPFPFGWHKPSNTKRFISLYISLRAWLCLTGLFLSKNKNGFYFMQKIILLEGLQQRAVFVLSSLLNNKIPRFERKTIEESNSEISKDLK